MKSVSLGSGATAVMHNICALLEANSGYSIYARFSDRHDVSVPNLAFVRINFDNHQIFLEVATGEWFGGENFILPVRGGEDWRRPTSFYAKHHCDGCHYPPDMCCLSRPVRDSDHDPMYFDDELSDEDAEAYAASFDLPTCLMLIQEAE